MCCFSTINNPSPQSSPLLSLLSSQFHTHSLVFIGFLEFFIFITMSITIERSKFIHGGMPRIPIYDSPRLPSEREADEDSCSSSSVGRNSDLSNGSSDGGNESDGESEVQSSFKGPLDTMNALEEVLPVKRGISNFYSGKSKSFTSLADASIATSIKDLAKPENPYTKKRKNLLAHSQSHSNFLDKSHNYILTNTGAWISKRPANSSRSMVPIGVTMASSGSNNNSEDSNSVSTSPPCCLPPLHPHSKKSPSSSSSPPPPRRNSPWRSFSLSDLQCVAAATPSITGFAICGEDEDNKLH